jgi:hypothetical protein
MVNVGFAAAGEGAPGGEAGKAGAMLIDLGKLEIGRSYTGLGVSAAAAVADSPAHNLAVVVTESEDPSVVLKAFAGAFDANKDSLSSALKRAINGE